MMISSGITGLMLQYVQCTCIGIAVVTILVSVQKLVTVESVVVHLICI